MNIAIIGGGAAGFFLAITLKQLGSTHKITIFEKSANVLAKVAITGGGRCNLTNSFDKIKNLERAYPRGDKLIKKAFKTFDHIDTFNWFENMGIPLIIQPDECVFPRSQNAQSIIDCFLRLSKELGIEIKTSQEITSISNSQGYELTFNNGECKEFFDIVAITTGGSPKIDGFKYLIELGHKIEPPIPSLFTFNIPSDPIKELMGIVVNDATVSLQGSKIKASGPLLITHWGMSGPAILKLSSYSARIVSQKNYHFNILVNWINKTNNNEILEYINSIIANNPNKLIVNIRPYELSSRLWLFLLKKADISEERTWGELGKKGINKIINTLSNDEYKVCGKGVFRDEFVTCGGVSLESINTSTMESKCCKNLYFAGEVLDIDAITGGFNLQAAWTTAYLAAKSIHETTK